MERIRLAGIIPMENGFALMHRKDVLKNPDMKEYYVFPGGGREGEETFEDGAKREIKEEFGIEVKIIKKMYEEYSEKFNQRTIYYLCEYVSGEFGTGDGPEFSNDPKYINSGKYFPEIIKKEDIEKLTLMPPDIKEKFVKDIKSGKIYKKCLHL